MSGWADESALHLRPANARATARQATNTVGDFVGWPRMRQVAIRGAARLPGPCRGLTHVASRCLNALRRRRWSHRGL